MHRTPIFFKTPAAFRAWLTRNHRRATELRVGLYKKGSGQPSITWPEAVDEALCFGWIDGIRHRLDELRYTIRFTPRKPDSSWSAVNLRRVQVLKQLGRMRSAGLRAFHGRDPKKSGLYSFEQRQQIRLTPLFRRLFLTSRKAWAYFRAQAPGYQRTATFWVMSAKQDATRLRRLRTLIADSGLGRRIGPLQRN